MNRINGARAHSAKLRQPHAGFTLIELMIVVAVIGILTAIAYPAYTDSVRKARRTDAKNALLDLAGRQERFFSMNNTYTKTAANLKYAAFPADVLTSGNVYYQLTVSAADGTSYSATATPTGAQANDKCGTYTINQLGAQGNTGGSASSTSCW